MSHDAFSLHVSPAHLERLARRCVLPPHPPCVSLDEVAALPVPVDVLVTGWGSPFLGADTLHRLPSLKLVAHAAGTLKAILDPALLHAGLRVTTVAAANAQPVAEFTLSWILRWNKRLDDYQRSYRQERSRYDLRARAADRVGNYGTRVGIVSASHVGRTLIALLRPFDIECLLYDPFVSADSAAALGARKTSLHELLEASDIVSLNAPHLPATENLMGEREFACMRDGSLFINTARGRIVDHDALYRAVAGGRLSAVLDVTHPEPLPDDSPLWELDNVWITPHVAGSLGREIARMSDWCIDEIERFADDEPLLWELRPDDWERVA